MPFVLPAALTALMGEAGTAAAAGSAGTAAAGTAAGGAASASTTQQLMQAATAQMASGGGGGGGVGGGGGGLTGYGLGGKTPKIPGLGFGLLGKAVSGLIKPLTTLPKQIEDWGQSLLDSKRNLMAFSGAIAGTMLEAERRDIHRKIQEGQRVSGSTDYLSEGLSDLKDEFQPLKDVIVNGFNLVAGTAIRGAAIATKIAKYTSPILSIALAIQKYFGEAEPEKAPFLKFIDDIQKGALNDDANQRNLMRPENQ